MKRLFYKILNKNKAGRTLLNQYFFNKYGGSANYWEQHYLGNGNSGTGSYGKQADFKADYINNFVLHHQVNSIIEWGCGDGNQLALLRVQEYVGVDVSKDVIHKCKQLFKDDSTKTFFELSEIDGRVKASLAISLDVVYHLVEDVVFEDYMHRLFASAEKYVIIYAWDVQAEQQMHVRHRKYSDWIKHNISNWELVQRLEKDDALGSCDFCTYRRVERDKE